MKFLTLIRLTFLMVLSLLLFTTCSTSKKTAGSRNMFRIPQKVVEADDLPEHLREETAKTEHVIQLFPEEVSEMGTETITTAPVIEEENTMAVVEDDPVEEIVKPFVYVPKEQRFFHIVSGSFLTKQYAEMFVSSLQGKGYANTYLKMGDNGFYRVIVQKYPNEVEARQYLHGYREDNPKYASAWLFYKRNGDGSLAFNQYY